MKRVVLLSVKICVAILFQGLVACGTEQSFIDKPKVGDVYQVECHNIVGHDIAYQLIKVRAISGDRVQVMPNHMYYHEKVYCIAPPDYFNSQAAYYIMKAEIKKMYVDQKIVEVFRLYEESCLGNDK